MLYSKFTLRMYAHDFHQIDSKRATEFSNCAEFA